MALKDLVIQSQLIPPRPPRGVLRRPRLDGRLWQVLDVPLTLVQAATGYGKSTALATLVDSVRRLCWYTVNEPDRDPPLFLAHLACAFGRLDPSCCDSVLQALEESGGRVSAALLTPLLNTLIDLGEGDIVLVLDDYHLVADVPAIAALVERLVDYAPPHLHVVLSARHPPPLAALARWRAKGQMMLIGQTDLAFRAEEITALFWDEDRVSLSDAQAEALQAETEGWVIALQLVRQSLQAGAAVSLDQVLEEMPRTMEALFDYLAQDVLARQSDAVQRFLLTTSVLRLMDGAACDHLLHARGSSATLRQLQESGLFVVSLGEEVYRYHRLFHDFLRSQLGPDRARSLHRDAATYYQNGGHPEEAVFHLLEAEDFQRAAERIGELGPRLIELGRFEGVSRWIARLPRAIQARQPSLDLLAGDILRLRARFDEALERYVVAERHFSVQSDRLGQSRALRGQAQVYLDTVRPLKADSLLEEALRLLEPEEHGRETAAVLDRLAENKLNLGHPDEAQALHHEAALLRSEVDPGAVYLEARALVRTGQLGEAQELLTRRAEEERQTDARRPQRFHRETLLLLSLVHTLLGDAEGAEACAREGIATGQRLGSAFVEAVGVMRLAHALQLQPSFPWDQPEHSPLDHAIAGYQQAIDLVRTFRVMRTQAEPLWGLCRAHAFYGDLPAAERYAQQALRTLRRAGDEWMQHLVQTTLGAGYVWAGQSVSGRRQLEKAAAGFARVGDTLGQTTARLWLALGAWYRDEADEAVELLSDLLPVVQREGYEALLTRSTFLGLPDEQALAPLLLEAYRRGSQAAYLARVLDRMGLGRPGYHPGYTLFVRTLGPFAVWRGQEPVLVSEWKREKARQVFQFLITYRGQWFHREQIADQLWPHLPPEAAERDFKVALNALHGAIEPRRPRGATPFFVLRRDSLYGLNPSAPVVVDSEEFARLAASEAVDTLQRALSTYQDDYLPDSLYEDWAAAERDRLRHLYLTTGERLARQLLRDGAWERSIQVSQEVLARDACWEGAYRLLMKAYAAKSNRAQVAAVYEQCEQTLEQELGIRPSPATRALFAQLA